MTTKTITPYHFRDVLAIATALEALERHRQRKLTQDVLRNTQWADGIAQEPQQVQPCHQ